MHKEEQDSEEEEVNLFVTCGPGLEPLLASELRRLGCLFLKEGCRGVYVDDATIEDCYRINYCSRIATRVLWPLKRFGCPNRDALYQATKDIPWELYIDKKATFAIDSNVSNNKQLKHSHFAGLVVKDAICDRLRDLRGERPNIDVENPDVQVNLYIAGNGGSIAIDMSGKPLHKRGYRQDGGEAPLEETLAAAILTMMKYDGTGVLCDPLCGSGTFLVEAALIASGTPPGFLRTKWGFMHHPLFNQETWLKVKNSVDKLRRPLTKGSLVGIECSLSMAQICNKNLRAAGFHNDIQVMQTDFSRANIPGQLKWIVANPPYDRRLTLGERANDFYRQLSHFVTEKNPKSYGVLFPQSYKLQDSGWMNCRSEELSNGGFPIQVVLKK